MIKVFKFIYRDWLVECGVRSFWTFSAVLWWILATDDVDGDVFFLVFVVIIVIIVIIDGFDELWFEILRRLFHFDVEFNLLLQNFFISKIFIHEDASLIWHTFFILILINSSIFSLFLFLLLIVDWNQNRHMDRSYTLWSFLKVLCQNVLLIHSQVSWIKWLTFLDQLVVNRFVLRLIDAAIQWIVQRTVKCLVSNPSC